jgi:hypothetical protein
VAVALETFELASIVLPASDGTLNDLGFSVKDLGFKSLGCVKEARGKKSQVVFPELNVSMWVANDELANVYQRAAAGEASYKLVTEKLHQESPLLYWAYKAKEYFPLTHLLDLEIGQISEIWDPSGGDLKKYYSGSEHETVSHLAIGIEELFLDDWKRFEKELAAELMFARFLPAGLAKIELSLYLKTQRLL